MNCPTINHEYLCLVALEGLLILEKNNKNNQLIKNQLFIKYKFKKKCTAFFKKTIKKGLKSYFLEKTGVKLCLFSHQITYNVVKNKKMNTTFL